VGAVALVESAGAGGVLFLGAAGEYAGRGVVFTCASMISSSCCLIAACASVLAYVGWVLFNNGLSFSLGFPKIASEIFLANAGVVSSRGNSPKRCFSLLFWRNSLISSTSSWTGMR
jgi:hypothetical protein